MMLCDFKSRVPSRTCTRVIIVSCPRITPKEDEKIVRKKKPDNDRITTAVTATYGRADETS